jgi:hypothetical protein
MHIYIYACIYIYLYIYMHLYIYNIYIQYLGICPVEHGIYKPQLARRAVTRAERIRVDLPLILGAMNIYIDICIQILINIYRNI